MEILVVTGQSGAGKSTCLHALEDLGVHCVDNLPVSLLQALAQELSGQTDRLAVGVDARDPKALAATPPVLEELVALGHQVRVLFFEADPRVLGRRFALTRRKHPMGELPGALAQEQHLRAPLRERATQVVDTSGFSARQLRQLVRDTHGRAGTLRTVLTSFGFRDGVPPQAELVFDARFLANPHEDPELRPLTGLHDPVASFVLGQPDAQTLLGMVEDAVRFWVPRTRREGRAYLTVAIGCTGGQHRSVALVEALARRLRQGEPLDTPAPDLVVRHRDVARAGGGA